MHGVRAAARCGPGPTRSFLAAATSAWIGYSVWSVTSPEILDFSMAPLWGLLVAAAAEAGARAGAGPGH